MKKISICVLLLFTWFIKGMEQDPVAQPAKIPSLKELATQAVLDPKKVPYILQSTQQRLMLNQMPQEVLTIPIPYNKFMQWARLLLKPLKTNPINLGYVKPEGCVLAGESLVTAFRDQENNQVNFYALTHDQQTFQAAPFAVTDSDKKTDNGFPVEKSLVSFLARESAHQLPKVLITPRKGKSKQMRVVDISTGTEQKSMESLKGFDKLLEPAEELLAVSQDGTQCIVGQQHKPRFIVTRHPQKNSHDSQPESVYLEECNTNDFFRFSHDGSIIYSNSSPYGQCYVWNASTGKKLFPLNQIDAIAFNDDMSRCMALTKTPGQIPPHNLTTYDSSGLQKIFSAPNTVVLALLAKVDIDAIPELAKSFTDEEKEILFNTRKNKKKDTSNCTVS